MVLAASPPSRMTDAQLLTLAAAIVLPLPMLIYSNSRITEAKETLRAGMQMGFERCRVRTSERCTHKCVRHAQADQIAAAQSEVQQSEVQ
jgi:hypothetical protein